MIKNLEGEQRGKQFIINFRVTQENYRRESKAGTKKVARGDSIVRSRLSNDESHALFGKIITANAFIRHGEWANPH